MPVKDVMEGDETHGKGKIDQDDHNCPRRGTEV